MEKLGDMDLTPTTFNQEEHSRKCSMQEDDDIYKPKKTTGRRHFPDIEALAFPEWTFYPEGYHYGKRCFIDGQRMGNCQTNKETTLIDIIGRRRRVYNQRAGLPMVADGDKSYSVPEYSYNFHKIGSTRPVINFSRSSKPVSDTFIPLQPLQRQPRRTYTAKKKEILEAEEIKEVIKLSKWRPSPNLTPTL